MATDAGAELRVDVHNIEPIPEADKDSTGLQQMWIWAGANIAPINWALGALGIVRADSRPWPQSAGAAKQCRSARRDGPARECQSSAGPDSNAFGRCSPRDLASVCPRHELRERQGGRKGSAGVAFGAPRALHGLEFRPHARHFLALRQLRVPGCRRARVAPDVQAGDGEEARERAPAGRARRRRRFVDAVAKLHAGAARLASVVVGRHVAAYGAFAGALGLVVAHGLQRRRGPDGGVKTRSSTPPQPAQRLGGGSVMAWRTSVRDPQAWHAYS